MYLNFNTILDDVSARFHELTIPQWLVVNGNASLPTSTTLPSFALKYVRYNDAWRAGYTIEPIDRFRHDDAEIPYGEKNDLLMSKAGVDFQVHYRSALISVNGFVHRSGGSPSGLQVVDGGRTGRIANDNRIGIMSFLGIGTIDMIPITPTMVYKTTESAKLADHAYIQLPYSTEGKTVLMAIGGYLHVLDEVYTRIGPKTVRINMNRIALPERYFDSLRSIDLSSLPLTRDPDHPGHVSVAELFSDEVIKAYLCLSQSFVIVVNTSDFFVRRKPVVNMHLPGRFEIPKGSNDWYPLVGAWGKLYDYSVIPDWHLSILSCTENTRPRYQFRTTHWPENLTIDDSLDTYRPWDWSSAQFLEMGRFTT